MGFDNTLYMKKRKLAENKNTPKDVLRKLAKNINASIRDLVASHSNTPKDALLHLATDRNALVRHNVAKNCTSSSKILAVLFQYERSFEEPDKYVIGALYYNKKLPYVAKKIIETLYGDML